jgi:hypothetical protein
MARGWESKGIESQQQDARERQPRRRELTAEERDRATRQLTLEMALASAQAELQAACRPAHREMLRSKLEAIRAELGKIPSE